MADALIERLDRAIEALLARGDATPALGDAELAPLARLAADLRYHAAPEFRKRLRQQLERQASMTATTSAPSREGFTTVTPYVIVQDERLVQFLTRAFDAVETFSARGSAGGIHREVRIGTSMVMIGELAGAVPKPVEFHVYVEDVDATFRRALDAGATSLGEPADRPYGERSAFVRDVCGNHWFIARALNGPATPAALRTVTPFLHAPDSAHFVQFLTRAFSAREEERHDAPDGRVMYARVRIGTAAVELGEAGEHAAAMPGYLQLQVSNVDAAYHQALEAGASPITPPAAQPHGGRGATVEDPMGNHWFLEEM